MELEMRRGRVDQLRKGNQSRLDRIQGLRSDPQTLERYAREKGYGRNGEIIQQLPEEVPAPAAPAAPAPK
jgi:hypothetical protein